VPSSSATRKTLSDSMFGAGNNPSVFNLASDPGSSPGVTRPKKVSKVDQISGGDLYMMQTSFERAQGRIKREGKKIDEERKNASDEHFGKCQGENDPSKKKCK